MSENLNEMVRAIVEDATVITVPIDDTLQNSGEAADAKAVGDALALKADKSELQTAITVNGQAADAQGKIIVTADDTKMSDSDNTTVKAAIEAVDGKTAEDIHVSSDPTSQTIAQALSTGATRTADQIAMSSSDQTTVKAAIEATEGDINNLKDRATALEGKTGADIPYNTGSAETIKQHVDAMESGRVRTVNEIGPDENGNVDVERVPFADNLYTEDMTQVDDSFLIRTTAGSGSLSSGSAWAQKLLGNSQHDGYIPEALNMTVNAMPRTAPAAITASIDQATFLTAVDNEVGTYDFTHDGTNWQLDSENVTMGDYGITISNDPIDGDEIVVVVSESGGTYSVSMTVNAATRTAPPAITATIDRDTWVGYVSVSGTTTFTYSTTWKVGNDEVDLANYGITVTNTPIGGDEIVVVYVKEVRGTITVAQPTRLVGTGWNLYDHSTGRAHVVKYSNVFGYAISGTYTALAFAATLDGEQETITPDEDGLFDVPSDGYLFVTGGNNTDTAIWTTWSDWDEGYDGPFETYKESAVSLSSIMTSYLPYGLCKIGSGSSAVCDELDFVHKQVISRITRMAYSLENLATVVAAGRPYEYDENYIYQVRASEVTHAITVDEEYQVDEHGLEFFDGSAIEIYAEILYGANLKDKLKRDVLTMSEQTLTSGQKTQVRQNLGLGAASTQGVANNVTTSTEGKVLDARQGKALQDQIGSGFSSSAPISDAIANTQGGLAYIVGNTNATGVSLAVGQYVYVKGHSTIPEGLRKVKGSSAIANGDSITTNNTEACSEGGLNSLFSNLTVIGTVYRESFSGGNKSYNTGDVIATHTVNKGVYIATFTPGYGLGKGTIVLGTDESNNPNRDAIMDAGDGFAKGSITAILTVNTDGTKIQLKVLDACSWQNNHSDFTVVKIR